MPVAASEDLKREIGRLRQLGMTVHQISEALDCSISTASKYQGYAAPDAEVLPPSKFSESGDEAKHEFAMRARIVTLDDAIRHGQVDTKVWYVDRWETTAWEMGYVAKATGKADSLPLWRVKLYLKRIAPKPLLDAADAIYERFATIAPKQFPKPPESRLGRPVMMALDLMDIHFGKLAWAPESGEDYDLKIAESRFRTAIARLMDHARHYLVSKMVIPIGNDLCHVDTSAQTTTAGTPMDCDGRHAKIVEAVVSAMIAMVDYSLGYADEIEIKQIPGNHDYLTSYFICRELKAYYRNCDRIVVDVEPTSRKYFHWGRNLLGFTHGKEFRDPRDLTIVMARENPQAFADSVCWEWHLGHLHGHKSIEKFGVITRVLSALSGTDAHHFNHGYVGNRKAAEAYFYDKTEGLLGNFIAGGE